MKIKIFSLFEYSSMITNYIIDVEINYNYSLNVIIPLGSIPCFHFNTITVYIWKLVIARNKNPYCGWLRNVSHKWSANSSLHAFFGWTVTNNFLFLWKMSSGILISLCLFVLYFFLFLHYLLLKLLFIFIWHDNDILFTGKHGSYLESLILNF